MNPQIVESCNLKERTDQEINVVIKIQGIMYR